MVKASNHYGSSFYYDYFWRGEYIGWKLGMKEDCHILLPLVFELLLFL